MHVILVSIGTAGDIYPYVGLGVELKARGHRVTLLASESYEWLARTNDFSFHPLVTSQENEELFNHPDFWHPIKTVPLSARWGLRFLRRQYELLSSLVTRDTVLVANPGVFAALLVHETHHCPIASLVLQPGIVPSSVEPPVMPGFAFMQHAPGWMWRLFWRGLDGVGAHFVGKELNALRGSLGLKPMRRLFQNWLSKQLALGMFPDWYGPPQPDWPVQLRLTGFPLVDGGRASSLAKEVQEFCDSGSPPIAFTFGTGMRHSAELFRTAAEAVKLGGQRAIFLTQHHDQLPSPLPASILHCAFAPFRDLFPQCAAVVHHGGIGTVAQVLAAGKPQLVLPICFDQEDNGVRVKRLGVGDVLPSRRRTAAQIATALSDLVAPKFAAGCGSFSSRVKAAGALEEAANQIELLHSSAKS